MEELLWCLGSQPGSENCGHPCIFKNDQSFPFQARMHPRAEPDRRHVCHRNARPRPHPYPPSVQI
eukprot:scaffold133765_cov60-Attheya_sp.AAC.13